MLTHVVRPGETLWSIAALYGVSPEEVMRANGITNPNFIYTGTTLRIPLSPSTPSYPTPPRPSGNLESRVGRLEQEVNNLSRRVRRLEQGR